MTNSRRPELSRAATNPKSLFALSQTPSEFVKKPIVKNVAGDAREPFLYRTALWLRHRCVYDHPPTRHASSPPHASRTWRSPRRPLAVDGRDAVVFSARARVRVFHRRRRKNEAPPGRFARDAPVARLDRHRRPPLDALAPRVPRRASRVFLPLLAPGAFPAKNTRASWGHRGFFRASRVRVADPSPCPAFLLPSPTDRQTWPAKCLSARRTSR